MPLAVEFAKKYPVIGYDISKKRVNELRDFNDITNEVNSNEFDKTLVFDQDELKKSNGLFLTDDKSSLQDNFYIVTVPTPINLEIDQT